MTEWSDFFVAQAGASAALAGLIFVAISISLDELIKFPHLLYRAAAVLILLLSVLVISSLLLAPLPSDRTAAVIVLVVGAVSWLATTWLVVAGLRQTPAQYRHRPWLSIAMNQVAATPLLVAGIVLLAEGSDGLYWLLPGFISCFVIALLDGWVLLVESHR